MTPDQRAARISLIADLIISIENLETEAQDLWPSGPWRTGQVESYLIEARSQAENELDREEEAAEAERDAETSRAETETAERDARAYAKEFARSITRQPEQPTYSQDYTPTELESDYDRGPA